MTESYALSHAQHLVWLGGQQRPDARTYEMEMVFALGSSVDAERFSSVWQTLVEGIGILRTTVDASGVAHVNDVVEPRHVHQSTESLSSWLQGPRCMPLNPAVNPFASVLLQTPQGWYWYFAQHHIIADATSTQKIFERLSGLYHECTWPSGNTDYAEYAKQPLSTVDDASGLIAELGAETAQLYGHVAVPDRGVVRVTRDIAPPQSRLWRELVEQHGLLSDSFANLQIVLTALLAAQHRTGHLPCLGVPLANRGGRLARRVIGPCMEIFPLHVTLDGTLTLAQLFELTGARTLEMMREARSGYTTPALLRHIPVLVNYLEMSFSAFGDDPTPPLFLPPRELEPQQLVNVQINRFDPTEPLTVHFDFPAGHLSASLQHHFVATWEMFLNALLTGDDRPLDAFALLDDQAHAEIATRLRGPRRPMGDDALLHQRFATCAHAHPERFALVTETESLTYQQLDERVCRFASGMLAVAKRVSAVALHLPVGVDFIAAMLAALKVGARYIPLDPEMPTARKNAILQAASPEIVVSLGSDWSDETSAELLSPDRLPAAFDVESARDPAAMAYTLFTSGSTGAPKGVTCSHRNVLNLLEEFERRSPCQSDARCSLWTQPGFDVSVYEMFSALVYGRTLYLMPEAIRLDAAGIHAWLREHGIQSTYLPPFLLSEFRDLCRRAAVPLLLERMLVGLEPIAEPLLSDIVASTPGLRLINGYGPTETTICTTLYEVRDKPAHEQTPIGYPIQNSQLYVLDRYLHAVPMGAVGELCVAGDGVSEGYLGDPERTAQAFVCPPDGGDGRMYRTGDLVRLLEDGALVFQGRVDAQMKVRGYRIEPAEVERAMREAGPVLREVVVAARDSGGRAVLVAWFVEHEEHWSTREWHEALLDFLPPYMIPSVFVPLERLPVTPSGKVDLRALPEPVWPGTDGSGSPGVGDAMQQAVVGAFETAFGTTGLNSDADFFELGGDSLLAVKVVQALRQRGYELTPRHVFEAPSIEVLAAMAKPTVESDTSSEASDQALRVGSGVGADSVSALLEKYGGEDTD